MKTPAKLNYSYLYANSSAEKTIEYILEKLDQVIEYLQDKFPEDNDD